MEISGPTFVFDYNGKTAYYFRKEIWRNPENSLNRKYLEKIKYKIKGTFKRKKK